MSRMGKAYIKYLNDAPPPLPGLKKGQCYQQAFRLVMQLRREWDCRDSETRLVHGKVFSPFFKTVIDHAWVRLNNDIVMDPSQGWVGRTEEWARISRCQDMQEFTLDEVSHYALRTGHYGPWVREGRP